MVLIWSTASEKLCKFCQKCQKDQKVKKEQQQKSNKKKYVARSRCHLFGYYAMWHDLCSPLGSTLPSLQKNKQLYWKGSVIRLNGGVVTTL